MSGRVYEQDIRIVFGDVDWARVMYFPNLFHYCHVAMEGFFGSVAGIAYPDLLERLQRGFPTARTEAVFHRPVPYGAVLRFRVTLTHIGHTSVAFRFLVADAAGGADYAEARTTTVCIDMGTFRPVPLPDDIRAAIEPYLE